MIDSMDWRIIIKQAQTRSGLTQTELAQKAHCSQSCIADLARGRTLEPRYSLGLRLLELANIQPAAPALAASGIETAAAGQGA